jgi:3-isopropylmalate dehydrogenase
MSKAYNIVILPGDGIGVEVANCAVALLGDIESVTELSFQLDTVSCGGGYYLRDGNRDWPEGSEDKCKNADAILLAAVGLPDPQGGGPVTMSDGRMAGYSPVIGNRVNLDLYANVRPVKLLPGVAHMISGERKAVWSPDKVDMVIIRENSEGLYAGMGGVMKVGGVASMASDVRVITRKASERVIRKAFSICASRNGAPGDGVKRVTAIVKNNVLDGCRLFAEVFAEVAKDFAEIETELAIVDAFTQWLVTEPERYDVCVTTNMFGDIVTDLASVLQGGMGMAVGLNLGDDHGMFEPIHGSAPPLAGKDAANPMAMLLATGEMLSWLGERNDDNDLRRAGSAVADAVAAVVSAGAPLTADLVGKDDAAPMSKVAEAVRLHTRQLLD